jgi:hypothetical protein
MPINILAQAVSEGLSSIPLGWTVVRVAPVFALLYLLKWYFNGAINGSERDMHSKVVIVTVSYILPFRDYRSSTDMPHREEHLA